ncbi:MAG TPA: bifunctional fucokinase/fucose-1-phosphate guanylyltransferase [Opitutaceae bacterium]|nr:bifunctional fucokinase/fucose-1-phosphate guanylyltransferase [Opitutaceae bacterium]
MPELLLTVPAVLQRFLTDSTKDRPNWYRRREREDLFLGADPAAIRLGSGGGTVHVLWKAWLHQGGRASLEEWLRSTQRLVLHSGGESRRLPAYSCLGKAFLPLPDLENLRPRIFDQTLSDFQVPLYQETLIEAGPTAAALVASGDVWLTFDPTCVPATHSDIVGLGMRVRPEIAKDFGVFFTNQGHSARSGTERTITRFLQKPTVADIQKLSQEHEFLVDTGLWLLSAAALEVLFKRCGWNSRIQQFDTPNGLPTYLDLYTEVGASLGERATPTAALKASGIRALFKSVIELPEARFYHVGSSRQLLESMEQLQWQSHTPRRNHTIATASVSACQNEGPTWEEGTTGSSPKIDRGSVVTGLPAGHRISDLMPGWCIDVAPVGASKYLVRPYHIDDSFRGAGKDGKICGLTSDAWLRSHGFSSTATDVFHARVYPVVSAADISDELIDWYFAATPSEEITSFVHKAELLSCAELPEKINYARYFDQRNTGYEASVRRAFERLLRDGDASVFEQDCTEIARFLAGRPKLKSWLLTNADAIEKAATKPEHQARFLLLLAQITKRTPTRFRSEAGFERLRGALVSAQKIHLSRPALSLKEDQIVWARSPARIDLAGGWTDTPPYCLEHGGAVLNVAVYLNGQPPIQVFIRPILERLIRLRSIDQGAQETIETFEALADFRHPRGSFSLPKAALSLAGFLPEFFQGKAAKSLKAHLAAFGAGLEISLLSAIPKGSGLGTSSIIGATLLAALNRASGLNWDNIDLYSRVLAMEQLLTTGGGWQDQAGAIFPGAKLIQTEAGPTQSPTVRYVTPSPLDFPQSENAFLLYYTGATRVAKGILQEIVRNMFLNDSQTVRILERIRANAWQAHLAFQTGSAKDIHRVVARSWRLNQQLDSGTRTAETDRIIEICGDLLSASKLLGAGGGGFMLLCAKDAASARQIRQRLESNPLNSRARFVDFSVAKAGLEVTVS